MFRGFSNAKMKAYAIFDYFEVLQIKSGISVQVGGRVSWRHHRARSSREFCCDH